MKRLRLALLIATVCAAACGGGGSDPVEPPPPEQKAPPVVTSGTFDATSLTIFDGCDMAREWNGEYDIDIDSTSFSMGSWTGTWDAKKAYAVGESVHDVTQTRDCTTTRWTTVYLTFTSEDEFSGQVIYRLRLGGDCGDRSTCSSSWAIAGTRRPPPP